MVLITITILMQVEEATADVEWKLNGSGPWNIGIDFELIHTPGHTEVRNLT
jgi:glyoxylase-like metal-dependent hydrolase (beta-lactamase superfamily II)